MKKLVVAIDAIRGPAACVSTHSIRVLVHFQVCVHLTKKTPPPLLTRTERRVCLVKTSRRDFAIPPLSLTVTPRLQNE